MSPTALRTDHPLRVLYVEDDATDADLVRRALMRQAPEIALDIVPTLADARRILETGHPAACDLVLCDLRLPDGGGLDLLAHVRERGLPVAVVMLAGLGDQTTAIAALKAGADDYLVKRDDYRERLTQALYAANERFRAAADRKVQAFHVIYAEHSPADIDLTRRYLAEHAPHIHLDVVGSATEVFERFRAAGADAPACDVLLLDYHLPGSTALEIARSLQVDQKLDLPIVIVTTSGSEEVVAEAMRLGVADYLTKQPGYLAALPATLEKAHRAAQLSREQAALRMSLSKLQLHAAALASTRDAVMITDLAPRIMAVNPAFTEITGYAESEVLGANPRLLQSGRQGRAFYQALWASLVQSGHWQGEIWNRRKDGETYPQWLTISTVRNRDGEPTHYVGVATDLTKLRQGQEQLDRLAHYDPLTDLPNRLLLQSQLRHAVEQARRREQSLAVLTINLDNFTFINESLGHEAGDELLVALAHRLRERVREEDTLARTGGDEFVLVLEGLHQSLDAHVVATALLASIAVPFVLADGHEAYLQASIGISVFPQDGGSDQDLLRASDTAMHRAKDQGGAQFAFHASGSHTIALAQLELDAALRRAMERHEFELHYQPKVVLAGGFVTGAEALLRWRHPGKGMIPPMEFVPVAEKSGYIGTIGTWVIDEVCRQLRAWQDEGIAVLPVAVNVSARQFRGSDLEALIRGALDRHGVAPQLLAVELTESMLMDAPDEAASRLARLKKIGIRLSLDDFGTGYSSLAYLSRFPIDELKIDRSFVESITSDPDAAAIATSVVALAHRMRLKVVAEGVETEAQLGYLRKHGCDEMQGFVFSRPLPAAEFAELLRSGRSLAVDAVPATGLTLLVVDDEPNILSAIRRLLRGENFRVLTARSAQEGLELLAKDAVQVILSDQRMPGMSGTDFLGRVKELHPDTVRIVLSGYAELDSIIRAVNTGALYKFLTKPWEDEQLREHIRDAFRYYEAVVKPRAAQLAVC
jgi:diguanylate cyclase (GGDEF)-like protein/PAS domain S-box-containing protein